RHTRADRRSGGLHARAGRGASLPEVRAGADAPGANPGTDPARHERGSYSGYVTRDDSSIVHVEELRKRYAGGPEAVAGIDFDVRRGEIFGLLGPNGAGKTTTIGAITTRVRPTGGRVLVDGTDVNADPVAVKLRIAVVPQMSNLDRSLTALENLT